MSELVVNSRNAIRQKVIQLLRAAVPDIKIDAHRFIPLEADEYPHVGVYALEESAEIYNVAPRKYERTLSLAVQVTVVAGDNAETEVDEIAAEIEDVMNRDDTLDGSVANCVYTGASLAHGENGENSVVVARLTYDLNYYTVHGIDSSTLDPFERANTTWQPEPGEGDETPDTVDDVELPQT